MGYGDESEHTKTSKSAVTRCKEQYSWGFDVSDGKVSWNILLLQLLVRLMPGRTEGLTNLSCAIDAAAMTDSNIKFY